MEVLDTSAGLPSEPVATQPPPDEPPVMVQPMRYIVGVGLGEREPARLVDALVHRLRRRTAAPPGSPVAVMLPISGTAGASKSTGSAEPTVSSRDLPPLPFSGVTWMHGEVVRGTRRRPSRPPCAIHWSEVCAQSPHQTPYGATSSWVAFSSSAADLASSLYDGHEGDVAVPAAALARVHAVARGPHQVGLARVGRVLDDGRRADHRALGAVEEHLARPRAALAWYGGRHGLRLDRRGRRVGDALVAARCRCRRRVFVRRPRRRASGPGPRGPR